ncbi:unnamed protein product [Candida verbasci]|uniref:Uncharacterized protein n=1 Tax=Candida verbasci TaxID=1227364 RepID=A0A9W4U0T6_9ASCO|nr:unnamed protein product [Candida verbasci]
MANPQEETYIQYLNYDWDSFTEFQTGLEEVLQNYLQNLKESDPSIIEIPANDKQQLINQAKSFFFCEKTGNIINIEDYNDWKLHNEEKYDKNAKIVEIKEEETSSDPPYSSNYQNLVESILSGKEIPGIKQIPDTVLTDSASTSNQKERLKPWEKNKKIPNEEDIKIV